MLFVNVWVWGWGLGCGWGLDAPAHPSATILWPRVTCLLIIAESSENLSFFSINTNTNLMHTIIQTKHKVSYIPWAISRASFVWRLVYVLCNSGSTTNRLRPKFRLRWIFPSIDPKSASRWEFHHKRRHRRRRWMTPMMKMPDGTTDRGKKMMTVVGYNLLISVNAVYLFLSPHLITGPRLTLAQNPHPTVIYQS